MSLFIPENILKEQMPDLLKVKEVVSKSVAEAG